MNVVVGFDISTHVMGQRLFDGHSHLESVLPGILEEISSISGVSCGGGSWTQVSLAFKVNSDQQSPTKFFIYKKDLFKKLLLTATVNGPSHLNGQFLQTLWDTFEDPSPSQGQVTLALTILQPQGVLPLVLPSMVINFVSTSPILCLSHPLGAAHLFRWSG